MTSVTEWDVVSFLAASFSGIAMPKSSTCDLGRTFPKKQVNFKCQTNKNRSIFFRILQKLLHRVYIAK